MHNSNKYNIYPYTHSQKHKNINTELQILNITYERKTHKYISPNTSWYAKKHYYTKLKNKQLTHLRDL